MEINKRIIKSKELIEIQGDSAYFQEQRQLCKDLYTRLKDCTTSKTSNTFTKSKRRSDTIFKDQTDHRKGP